MHVHTAGTIRTACLLFTGMVQVPRQDGGQAWTTTQREKERERSEKGAQGNGGGRGGASKAQRGKGAAALAAAWRVQAMPGAPMCERWAVAGRMPVVGGAELRVRFGSK